MNLFSIFFDEEKEGKTVVVIRITIGGMEFLNGHGIVTCLPLPVNSHSHSEAEVGEKRLAPNSAQELPGPSVGVTTSHD